MQLHLLWLLKQAEQWPPHAQLLRAGTPYSVTACMDICYSAGLNIGAVMNVNDVRFSASHTKSDTEAHTPSAASQVHNRMRADSTAVPLVTAACFL